MFWCVVDLVKMMPPAAAGRGEGESRGAAPDPRLRAAALNNPASACDVS